MDDIRVRLADKGLTSIYSVMRRGQLIESAVVRPTEDDAEDVVAPGYHGGSEAMD